MDDRRRENKRPKGRGDRSARSKGLKGAISVPDLRVELGFGPNKRIDNAVSLLQRLATLKDTAFLYCHFNSLLGHAAEVALLRCYNAITYTNKGEPYDKKA